MKLTNKRTILVGFAFFLIYHRHTVYHLDSILAGL